MLFLQIYISNKNYSCIISLRIYEQLWREQMQDGANIIVHSLALVIVK